MMSCGMVNTLMGVLPTCLGTPHMTNPLNVTPSATGIHLACIILDHASMA